MNRIPVDTVQLDGWQETISSDILTRETFMQLSSIHRPISFKGDRGLCSGLFYFDFKRTEHESRSHRQRILDRLHIDQPQAFVRFLRGDRINAPTSCPLPCLHGCRGHPAAIATITFNFPHTRRQMRPVLILNAVQEFAPEPPMPLFRVTQRCRPTDVGGP